MQEYTDPHDVISIRVEGAEVDAVSVRNSWRDHYDATEFAAAINELLKQAMPALAESTARITAPAPTVRRRLSTEEQMNFWNEFMMYESRMTNLRKRIAAGELTEATGEVEISDPRKRVGVLYVNGRFQEIGFDPTWLADAPMQTLSETITDTLRKHPLSAERPLDPDLADVAERRTNLRAILLGR